jgi:membrane protein implicated in regulation of membrane protease activity
MGQQEGVLVNVILLIVSAALAGPYLANGPMEAAVFTAVVVMAYVVGWNVREHHPPKEDDA